MFRHDVQHTGRSPVNGPSTPTVRWRYQTGEEYSSPAIGADGTIYIGSYDHSVYALTPAGTLKWRYLTDDIIDPSGSNGAGGPSPAIGADGTIYVGFYTDKYVYAIGP